MTVEGGSGSPLRVRVRRPKISAGIEFPQRTRREVAPQFRFSPTDSMEATDLLDPIIFRAFPVCKIHVGQPRGTL